MSSAEIKMDIIRLIDQVDDNEKLKAAYVNLLSFLEVSEDVEDGLDAQLEESLAVSLTQISEGKIKPHEEVMASYRKKFGS